MKFHIFQVKYSLILNWKISITGYILLCFLKIWPGGLWTEATIWWAQIPLSTWWKLWSSLLLPFFSSCVSFISLHARGGSWTSEGKEYLESVSQFVTVKFRYSNRSCEYYTSLLELMKQAYTDLSQFYPQEYMSYKSKYLYLFNPLLYPRHLKEKLAHSIYLNTNNTYKYILL